MQLSTASIYISLKQLRRKLYAAQFLMDKSARIIYGTPLMQSCGDAIKYFTMAYTNKTKKSEYLDVAIGSFAVLRTDIEMCMDCNLIHYRKDSNDKVEILKIVAKIDDEMCRWQASLTKGKTVAG